MKLWPFPQFERLKDKEFIPTLQNATTRLTGVSVIIETKSQLFELYPTPLRRKSIALTTSIKQLTVLLVGVLLCGISVRLIFGNEPASIGAKLFFSGMGLWLIFLVYAATPHWLFIVRAAKK